MNFTITYTVVTLISVLLMLIIAAAGTEPFPILALPPNIIMLLIFSGPIACWASRRIDTFSPIVILSIFSISYFVLSPTYQICFRYFPYLNWSESYNEWYVAWAYMQLCFVLIALLFYRITPAIKRKYAVSPSNNKQIRFMISMTILSFTLKILTFLYFGGIGGYISAYSDRIASGVIANNPFAGLGPLVLIGDMFPIFFGTTLIVILSEYTFFRKRYALFAFLIVMSIISIFVVGLRGSRSTVAFGLAVLALTYHYYVRRLSKGSLVWAAIGLVTFMNYYLIYKFGGIDAVFSETIRDSAFQARQIDNPIAFVFARDFGRMDMQTITLSRMIADDYPLSLGRSILSGFLSIVPSGLLPFRPETFILEKTEIIFPNRTFDARLATTFVFGGFGELFVNFGFASFLFAAPAGYALRKLNSAAASAKLQHWTAIMAPAACLLPVAFIIYDSNSMMYFTVQFILPSWILATNIRRRDRKKANFS